LNTGKQARRTWSEKNKTIRKFAGIKDKPTCSSNTPQFGLFPHVLSARIEPPGKPKSAGEE
jgi:hypothetical protein